MENLGKHLRSTFLAGVFAAIPLAVTGFIIYYAEEKTRVISEWLIGQWIPFLGVIIALVAIYLLGLLVSSLIGKWLIRILDSTLERLPLFRELYRAWKQVTVTPGGGEGMFARVVLIPEGPNRRLTMAFTSGEGLPTNPDSCCVFVPAAPNPMNGRLYFVKRADCIPTTLSADEAFKLILSGGNYIPDEIGTACATPLPPPEKIQESPLTSP